MSPYQRVDRLSNEISCAAGAAIDTDAEVIGVKMRHANLLKWSGSGSAHGNLLNVEIETENSALIPNGPIASA